jgi:hypothetical protein
MTLRDLCLVEPRSSGDEPAGELVDRYLEFVATRCRPNTVAAVRSDLGVLRMDAAFRRGGCTATDAWRRRSVDRTPRRFRGGPACRSWTLTS